MINVKSLYYYLESATYFEAYIMPFFDMFGHCGNCLENIEERDTFLNYASEIAFKTFQRKNDNCGFFLFEEEVPEWLSKYYNIEYSDEQMFALVFGAWWGLSKEECHMIANRKRKNFSWTILNCFLCGMSCTEVQAVLNDASLSSEQKREILSKAKYAGEYEVYKGEKQFKTKRNGNVFTDITTGKRFFELI